MTTPSDECRQCGGEGLVDFTDEEWIAKYGVPMSEYKMTGKEPETMKTCPGCNGSGAARKGPEPGTWAATARMMAQGDDSGFDWDAWKDQMKEQDF